MMGAWEAVCSPNPGPSVRVSCVVGEELRVDMIVGGGMADLCGGVDVLDMGCPCLF